MPGERERNPRTRIRLDFSGAEASHCGIFVADIGHGYT